MHTEAANARIAQLAASGQNFTYDVRSNCVVYDGIIGAYKSTWSDVRPGALEHALKHALDNDGIVHVWHDEVYGHPCYASCRLFTDVPGALRFVQQEGGSGVLNLNRGELVPAHSPLAA